MGLARDPRNLRKLKAIRRAEFALKQRLERIDWEEDVLNTEIAEFEGRAQLPELPSEAIVQVEYIDVTPKGKRAARARKPGP